MPPIETMECNEYALVWAKTGQDRYDEPIRDATGVEIRARWEWVRSSSRDANGDQIVLDAKVVVDRDVPLYSLMFQGRMTDFIGTGSAEDQEIVQVVTFNKVPDVNGREYRRVAGVQRFRSRLPDHD